MVKKTRSIKTPLAIAWLTLRSCLTRHLVNLFFLENRMNGLNVGWAIELLRPTPGGGVFGLAGYIRRPTGNTFTTRVGHIHKYWQSYIHNTASNSILNNIHDSHSKTAVSVCPREINIRVVNGKRYGCSSTDPNNKTYQIPFHFRVPLLVE